MRLCVKTLLVAALALSGAALAPAQDATDAPAAKKKADATANDAPKKDAAKAPAKPENQVVKSIRESKPGTPRELLRAVGLLLDLGALPQAEEYFKQLAAMPLTDAQRVELGREFDAGLLFRIAQHKPFGPDGPKFVQSVSEAMRKSQENPARIAQLVQDLGSPDELVRQVAVADLAQTGRAALEPLLAVLADPQRQNVHREAQNALAAMGNSAVPALLAVFDSAGPQLQSRIVPVLAASTDPQAAEALLALTVTPGVAPEARQLASAVVRRSFGDTAKQLDVAALLMRQIDDYLKGERRVPADENNVSRVWRYDARSNSLTEHPFPPETAAAFHATRLAGRLRAIAPNTEIARQWFVLSNLQAAKLVGGMRTNQASRKLLKWADALGPAAIAPVLRLALDKNHLPAALGALEVLAAARDSSLLAGNGSKPGLLLSTASHPDRRIRLAAIEAVVALKPAQPLAGLSAVSRGLMEFASVSGVRRAVVADPRANRAHALAALLDQCGFTTSLATSGREAFQEAAGSTEVELVLIVMTVENPDADELLRQLRRDPRTARLPVGLIADPDRLYRAEGIALADPLTSAFVRPRDLKTMQERVKTLEGLSGVNHVPHAERLEQARRAMGIISVLTAKPQQLYDFQGVDAAVEPALMVPELWPAAIQVLVHCHTPRAQKALADLASAGTQSIDTRKVAAAAFAESVKRHGIQLSIAQIKHQARLYDQSASLDQPTQDVLWSLLETMQKTKEKANPPPPKKA